MKTQITIRDIPETVRDALVSKAARKGQSLQEFLLAELHVLSQRLQMDEWLEGTRRLKLKIDRNITSQQILEALDAHRKGGLEK